MQTSEMEAMNKFEIILANMDSPVLGRLQEGLQDAYVRMSLLRSDLFDDRLISLYTWKNGNRPDLEDTAIERLELFPEAIMLSLDDAIAVNKLYVQQDYMPWQKDTFPLFTNGGGDYLVLDTNTVSGTKGMILSYAPSAIELEEFVPIYDSMELLFVSVIECIRLEAYKYRSDGTIDIDFDLRQKICGQLNPNSGYWKGEE
jgi:hypothetical protein